MRKANKPAGAARSLIKSSPHRTTGGVLVEGLTVGDAEYESRNEANALNTMLLCHDVHKIASQPLKEAYVLEGKEHFYTPDFIVDAFEPGLRLEVKSIGYLVRTESDWNKYLAIAASYWNQCIPFAFLVDAQLEIQPRQGNVNLLVRYVTSKLPDGIVELASQALVNGPLTVEELIQTSGLALVDVLSLVAKRVLCIDWDVAFDQKNSQVSLPGKPYEGLKLEDILRSSRYGDFLAQMALGRRAADRRILAGAKTWRRRGYNPQPWAMVGGYVERPPMRALSEGERLPRNFGRRKDFAPGQLDIGTSQRERGEQS